MAITLPNLCFLKCVFLLPEQQTVSGWLTNDHTVIWSSWAWSWFLNWLVGDCNLTSALLLFLSGISHTLLCFLQFSFSALFADIFKYPELITTVIVIKDSFFCSLKLSAVLYLYMVWWHTVAQPFGLSWCMLWSDVKHFLTYKTEDRVRWVRTPYHQFLSFHGDLSFMFPLLFNDMVWSGLVLDKSIVPILRVK